MKPQEAISAINHNMPTKGTYTILTEGLELAVKALEKQIPMKPIITEFINDEIAVYECKCGLAPQFRYKEHKHCPECGQKLDWSES